MKPGPLVKPRGHCVHGLPGVMVNALYCVTLLVLLHSSLVFSREIPLTLLLFCLVVHQVVCAIATDSECASLLFHTCRWHIDDGVVAGPIFAVLRVLSIVKDFGSFWSSYQFVPSVNYLVPMTSLFSQMK